MSPDHSVPASLVVQPTVEPPAPLEVESLVPGAAVSDAELERAKLYASARHAPATRRAYETDFRIFAGWASARGLAPLPAHPTTIAAFLASEADAGVAVSTLEHRLAAIRIRHLMAGLEAPTTAEAVRSTLAGIRRTRLSRQKQKAPATIDLLDQLLESCDDSLHGIRDRALLLLGFAGAFRRSELVAIEYAHLTWETQGLRVLLLHSKTDQNGKGEEVAILRGTRLCPIEALRAWLAVAKIIEGPVFRGVLPDDTISSRALSDRSVALIVKRRARAAGLDDEIFAGHSLRAGFLTSAAEAGAGIFAMMDVSRHKSVETLRGYIRRADAFKNHAAKGLL
jgi:site-specific recombinase XerD